jgi:hypothetical protein
MKQTNSNKHVIEGLIAIVVLAGLTWFIISGRQASAPNMTDTSSGTNTQTNTDGNTSSSTQIPATTTPSGNDVVVVSTQSAGTKTITIDNVNLSKPGFVVIGVADSDAALLGSSKLLSAGTKQDLEITLTRALDSNHTYVALIYQDDGNKKFDQLKDTMLSGKGTSSKFTAK